MDERYTTKELEFQLGDDLKQLRLQKNIDQKTLCKEAGISLTALRNLENGRGATITTLVKTLRALNHIDALRLFAPQISINPLQLSRQAQPRQRARTPKET
ncbi:MAG: helix-turn-helix domain-containing protein [Undibacterium sp.]|nr:helix-turn-helix domain-containing protein [Undibacterium sp.]